MLSVPTSIFVSGPAIWSDPDSDLFELLLVSWSVPPAAAPPPLLALSMFFISESDNDSVVVAAAGVVELLP